MPILHLNQPVGRNSPNRPEDVKAAHDALAAIGKLTRTPCSGLLDDEMLHAIEGVQQHFLARPDGVISVGGKTQTFLTHWKEKPVGSDVKLPGRLREAWDLVSPLLPEGSYCSSGYRSAEEQRRILHDFFRSKYRASIIAKYGKETYDTVAKNLRSNEQQVLKMVRGVGQQIAAPGASKHQQGKAIDVGGPSAIDDKQVEVIRLVAHAHPDLFSGFVIKERNGCVHFEIR